MLRRGELNVFFENDKYILYNDLYDFIEKK